MRDDKIDVLRFIGLAMVILAHVGTPGILFQARNFDVPLMVIVSGLSFTASQKQERYRDYLTKRLTRLVLPVWLFLTAYFLANEIFNFPLKTLSAEDILSSYALQSGIGYVWIIRVFALVAIAAPFIYKLSHHQANTRHLYTLLVILAVHELLCFARRKVVPDFLVSFVDDYLLYLVPYGVIFSFGTRLKSLDAKSIQYVCVFSGLAFLSILCYLSITTGQIVQTQQYKYPPQAYYLSYAIFISTAMWIARDNILLCVTALRIGRFVFFCAKNSIWIYLWHIPLLEIIGGPFYLKYICVLLLATGITRIQNQVVTNIIIPKVRNQSHKNIVYSVLIG